MGALRREEGAQEARAMTVKTISFTLNGDPVTATVAAHHSLLEVVRDGFSLYGARESCGQGLCGCCTVLLEGVAVSGCLYLAVAADGKAIATVESLDEGGVLSPVQQAFIDSGAFQCGFCTPGFVLMTHQLLERKPDPTEDEIRHYLSGNLCRCAAYPEIIDAVHAAAKALKQTG
jgi:aerobic carbon-monoxide dehydrogenase small subunit